MEKNQPDKHKKEKGFAAMDPGKQKEIASKGGRAAHQHGTAHEWNSEEARKAARKAQSTKRGNYFSGDDMPML